MDLSVKNNLRIEAEDDQGGPLVLVHYDQGDLPLLTTYVNQFNTWKASPLEHEVPLIPIYFDAKGTARFCRSAATQET